VHLVCCLGLCLFSPHNHVPGIPMDVVCVQHGRKGQLAISDMETESDLRGQCCLGCGLADVLRKHNRELKAWLQCLP
jgi:hypothetical protein